MERDLAAEIIHRGVANLANSLAIGGDLRLALNNFISQSRCPRINQRFLKLTGEPVSSSVGSFPGRG